MRLLHCPLAHITTSNPTDLLSFFSNSQRQLIAPLPSSFWCRTVDMDNKWLVRCLPVKAFAADQPQAHVQVLWPPTSVNQLECKLMAESKKQAALCAQYVTRLLSSALQHRLSKAVCNHHDCTVIIRHKITTSSASENQKPPQRAQASSTFLQGIRFINHVKEHKTLRRGAKT